MQWGVQGNGSSDAQGLWWRLCAARSGGAKGSLQRGEDAVRGATLVCHSPVQGQSPAEQWSPMTKLERVHAALQKAVNKATKKIADQEKDWDQVELCKRIVRYLYKGAQAPELLTLPWHQAAEQFVDTAMQGFTAACGDKPWFFDMDLTSAFGMSFWEIYTGSGQRANWSEVEAVLNGKYEQLMDLCLLEKAMWDSAGGLIPDQEPLRNKLYKALKTSHESAFKEATEAPRMGDLQRVELFTRAWIEGTVNKSYSVLEQAEGYLMNPDSVVQLFQELVAPFGEEHPFSCIPAVLTQSIGRPPKDWDFLQEAVRQFFLNWNNPDNGAGDGLGYGQRRGAPRGLKRPFDAFGAAVRPAKSKGWERRGLQASARQPSNLSATQETADVADSTGAVANLEDKSGVEGACEDPVAQALMEQVAAAEAAAEG
ncbi:ASPH [Symbiodinium natans]|uniref:ASPH protein n=1 Tax=Symbiodinium natans TaxID=878477 RepID=A0A812QIC5_9DINO|nr:ASPH [Symbiodinium natans]